MDKEGNVLDSEEAIAQGYHLRPDGQLMKSITDLSNEVNDMEVIYFVKTPSDYEMKKKDEEDIISVEKVNSLLNSIRGFFNSIPFVNPSSLSYVNCGTILDILDKYEMPLNHILGFILPALGYKHIRVGGISTSIKNYLLCFLDEGKSNGKITG